MPRKPRKPGICFWVWTFAVGVVSPGKGKRRVNSRMTELYEGIKQRDAWVEERDDKLNAQNSYIEFLGEQLAAKSEENNRLLTALHMDECMETVVNMRTPSRSRESADEQVDTLSIPVVSTK